MWGPSLCMRVRPSICGVEGGGAAPKVLQAAFGGSTLKALGGLTGSIEPTMLWTLSPCA